jgi:hypothetical protein
MYYTKQSAFLYFTCISDITTANRELQLSSLILNDYSERYTCQHEGKDKCLECGLEQEYWNRVEEGFQVTPSWHQGFLRDNGRYGFKCQVWHLCP